MSFSEAKPIHTLSDSPREHVRGGCGDSPCQVIVDFHPDALDFGRRRLGKHEADIVFHDLTSRRAIGGTRGPKKSDTLS